MSSSLNTTTGQKLEKLISSKEISKEKETGDTEEEAQDLERD